MAKVGKFCLAKRVKVEWLFQSFHLFKRYEKQRIYVNRHGSHKRY